MLNLSKDACQIITLIFLINVSLISYFYLVKNRQINGPMPTPAWTLSPNSPESKNSKPEKELVHGFHDHFDPDINVYLGWRGWYLRHQTGEDKVPCVEDSFSGTLVRNYLDKMDNVINEVTPRDKQIR